VDNERKRPGRKPSELFYRKEADAYFKQIREEAGLACLGGLPVEYVCRNNPVHRFRITAMSYDEGRCCVFCGCLMSATVIKEQPCTDPQ